MERKTPNPSESINLEQFGDKLAKEIRLKLKKIRRKKSISKDLEAKVIPIGILNERHSKSKKKLDSNHYTQESLSREEMGESTSNLSPTKSGEHFDTKESLPKCRIYELGKYSQADNYQNQESIDNIEPVGVRHPTDYVIPKDIEEVRNSILKISLDQKNNSKKSQQEEIENVILDQDELTNELTPEDQQEAEQKKLKKNIKENYAKNGENRPSNDFYINSEHTNKMMQDIAQNKEDKRKSDFAESTNSVSNSFSSSEKPIDIDVNSFKIESRIPVNIDDDRIKWNAGDNEERLRQMGLQMGLDDKTINVMQELLKNPQLSDKPIAEPHHGKKPIDSLLSKLNSIAGKVDQSWLSLLEEKGIIYSEQMQEVNEKVSDEQLQEEQWDPEGWGDILRLDKEDSVEEPEQDKLVRLPEKALKNRKSNRISNRVRVLYGQYGEKKKKSTKEKLSDLVGKTKVFFHNAVETSKHLVKTKLNSIKAFFNNKINEESTNNNNNNKKEVNLNSKQNKILVSKQNNKVNSNHFKFAISKKFSGFAGAVLAIISSAITITGAEPIPRESYYQQNLNSLLNSKAFEKLQVANNDSINSYGDFARKWLKKGNLQAIGVNSINQVPAEKRSGAANNFTLAQIKDTANNFEKLMQKTFKTNENGKFSSKIDSDMAKTIEKNFTRAAHLAGVDASRAANILYHIKNEGGITAESATLKSYFSNHSEKLLPLLSN